MKEISTRELYGFYLDTLGHCTSKILSLSDAEIEYELFEEFDAGAHSFLHQDALAKLYAAGYLGEDTIEESKEIRRKWLELQTSPSIAEIKSSNCWRELFKRCDQLLQRMKV